MRACFQLQCGRPAAGKEPRYLSGSVSWMAGQVRAISAEYCLEAKPALAMDSPYDSMANPLTTLTAVIERISRKSCMSKD